MATTARLKERYEQELRQRLIRQFGYTTPMQAPRVEKITLNMGVGDAKQDSNMLEAATDQLATIAGQRPNVRRARKSIANFKLRDGMPVGVSVTLRHERAHEFLDRLMSIAIPRIRDFRGLNPRSFDGRGNYSMGIREQIIFPEIDYDAIDQVRGLDVTITTTARTDEEAFALLESFGMPFAQEGRPGTPAVEPDAGARRRRAPGPRPSRPRSSSSRRRTPTLMPSRPSRKRARKAKRKRRKRARWRRPRRGCGPAARRSTRRATTPGAAGVGARARCSASSACAGSASASWPTRASSPG